ncbi:hypothetical protein [Euzebyella saccharophila]|uniref:GH26 domain-containing protein n=1 Tax=Euzebyella saccharophila TaxID=679664 RepID=A0ABV8JZE0_9FLAO|nr:hypothetical protein [Euzebyella saccharophila]
MHSIVKSLVVFAVVSFGFQNALKAQEDRFNKEKDLLLGHFDCKTDVDDLHTVAAFKSLMVHPEYTSIKYHAVAGTYGEQEGLYVTPNSLFKMAFGNNWTDAHKDFEKAVVKVKKLVKKTLDNGGRVWIAEAGQSDFSAALMKAVAKEDPRLSLKDHFLIVQHSDWNEKVTNTHALEYVQNKATYHKIPDGNAVGNGTPGFRSETFTDWDHHITNSDLLKLWEHAIELGLQYNGVDGRYNNVAVAKGGVDFSDLSEVCWLLGIENIRDSKEFFNLFLTKN